MIHLVIGKQGSGKTLFLVKTALDAVRRGKTIYSNIALDKAVIPYKQLDYEDIIECRLNDGVVLLDEVHLLLPARNSMSKQSRIICDSFLSMVRKKNLEVYGTTQLERKVDIRFREEKDYFYVCSKHAYMNSSFIEVTSTDKMPENVPVFIKIQVQEQFSGNWVTISFQANELYSLYNTRQIIKIKGLEL